MRWSLHLRGRTVSFVGTAVMGVVNATPDSFSDAGESVTLEQQLERAFRLVGDGAHIIDVGGQSGITGVPEVDPAEEIRRVVPVIRRLRQEHPRLIISVDTYKPKVAEASLRAGADIVNDTSGLRYPEILTVVREHEAGLVLMHNVSRPKERITDPTLYEDVVLEVKRFLQDRVEQAANAGVSRASLVLDPGPDFSKSPYHTVEILRRLGELSALGLPMLLAVSRKDFIGVITNQPPDRRLAGTLAAVGHVAGPMRILRVHDVREVRDYLAVSDVLAGRSMIDPNAQLDPELRRVRASVVRSQSVSDS